MLIPEIQGMALRYILRLEMDTLTWYGCLSSAAQMSTHGTTRV
jgi:hypothetical protein